MKRALAMMLLLTAAVFATGEFQTGCAEMAKFSGYGLFRYDFFGMEDVNPEKNMRAYFSVSWDPKLNSHVSGRMQFDLLSSASNSIRLADAYLNLKLSGNVSLMGGQFKTPFGYANTRSGGSMYFADRAYISGMGDYKNYAARDNGLCLIAAFDPITLDLALFNGTGSNEVADNDVNNLFAARVTADATDWVTLGLSYATIGQPEIADSAGVIPSWSSSGIDLFAQGKYPIGENAKLLYEVEYAMLGRTGPEVSGVEKNDATAMSAALGAEFGVGEGFVRTVRPAVRYDMRDPSYDGSTDPENDVTVLDFCLGLDLTSGRNTLQLGARNYAFENENVDGFTDIYLNWRMNF